MDVDGQRKVTTQKWYRTTPNTVSRIYESKWDQSPYRGHDLPSHLYSFMFDDATKVQDQRSGCMQYGRSVWNIHGILAAAAVKTGAEKKNVRTGDQRPTRAGSL